MKERKSPLDGLTNSQATHGAQSLCRPFTAWTLTSEIEFHIRQLTTLIIASLTGWDSILDALCVSGIF